MINAITNAELDVVDKQKQSVDDALSPDSAFIDNTTTTREISVNFKYYSYLNCLVHICVYCNNCK